MKAKKEDFQVGKRFYHFRLLDDCKPYFSLMEVTRFMGLPDGSFIIDAKLIERPGEANMLGRFKKHWKGFELSAGNEEIESMMAKKAILLHMP